MPWGGYFLSLHHPYSMTQRKAFLVLGLISVSAAVLSLFMLTRDNGWGDDFAGYILQAQSIVRGDMRELISRNTFTIENSSYNNNPANYPWGFPLMLAPVYALFGIKVLALKSVLTLCHVLLIPAAFLLARTRLSETESLILAALVAYNGVLLTEGQGEVLSDIPFTLLSIVGLWLIVRPCPLRPSLRDEVARRLLTGAAIFAAAFIRPNGFLLCVPLAAVQFSRLAGQEHASSRRLAILGLVVPLVGAGLLYALQALIFPSTSLRNVAFSLAPQDLWRTFLYYAPLLAYFFRHLGAAAYLIYALQLVLYGISLTAHGKRDLPLHLYVLATLLLYVAFPYLQGARYLYPVWPVFLLFSLDGMRVAAGYLKPGPRERALAASYGLWCTLAIFSLAFCARFAWINMSNGRNAPTRTWGAFSVGSTEMFDFIRHNTPAGSTVIFYKPRAMRLRTDRNSFLTTDCSALPRGDYVVTVESNASYDQIAPERVRDCNPHVSLTPIYMKDLFIVYQIGRVQ
jgi:hypothetical protein